MNKRITGAQIDILQNIFASLTKKMQEAIDIDLLSPEYDSAQENISAYKHVAAEKVAKVLDTDKVDAIEDIIREGDVPAITALFKEGKID